LLPEAKYIYEKRKKTEIVVEEWDSVTQELQKRQMEAKGSINLTDLTLEQIVPVLVMESSSINKGS
jgi:predicted GTPase